MFNITVRYVLIAGPLSTDRMLQHTKRFSGGKEMVGTAAQEIEEKVEQTKKPYWEQQGEIKATQNHFLATLTERFDVVGLGSTEKILAKSDKKRTLSNGY